MQIGILGGTFNPIHNGHLHIADVVLNSCRLDQVWFMPSFHPPHKELDPPVSYAHRLAMVKIAVATEARFIASDLEGQRAGLSFSVQTLEELHQHVPQHEFTFIMGLDSFAEIGLWKSYPRLFELCHIAVAARPGFRGDLRQLLPVAVAKSFCYDADALTLIGHSGYRIRLISQTTVDVSSTQIRQRLLTGETITDLLPLGVARYIEQHHLYR